MKMTVEGTSHPENSLGLIFSLMFRVFLALFLNFNQISGSCSYKIGCYLKGFYLTKRNCSFFVGIFCFSSGNENLEERDSVDRARGSLQLLHAIQTNT